jgi:transposase
LLGNPPAGTTSLGEARAAARYLSKYEVPQRKWTSIGQAFGFCWKDVVMSGSRRKFSTEFKVEAAHRVIDSGRSIAEVARDLSLHEVSLGNWVRDERRRIEAARGTVLEPLSGVERIELLALRKVVAEQAKDLLFLGKAAAYFAANPAKRSDSR